MRERTVQSKTIDLTRLVDDPTWPTKRQDVLAAIQIIQHHATRTGEPILQRVLRELLPFEPLH